MVEIEKNGQNQNREGRKEVSFADFVFLQYQQGRLSLGMFPNPQTGKFEESLPLAEYSIEVLSMLKRKTSGNLDEQELRLLEQVLHDLRLGYVEKLHAAAARKESGDEGESGATEPSAANEKTEEKPDAQGGEKTQQPETDGGPSTDKS